MKINNTAIKNLDRGISSFAPDIIKMREVFLSAVGTFQEPLRDSIVRNYSDRIQRGKGKPLLGEYAPWILSDLYSIKNRELTSRISSHWINLYAHTLLIDDVLDGDADSAMPPLLLASSLLLQRGLSGMAEIMPKKGNVRLRFDQYFLEAASAALKEIRLHRNRIMEFDETDMRSIGEKVALLKLCATCLLIGSGKTSFEEDCLLPVEILTTGMQLLDDISDWADDYDAGNYSFLLTRALTYLRANKIIRTHRHGSLTHREVFVGIILSGALEECISKATSYLNEVAEIAKISKKSPTFHLFTEIIGQQESLRKDALRTRGFLEEKKASSTVADSDWVAHLARDREVVKQVRMIQENVKVFCTNS